MRDGARSVVLGHTGIGTRRGYFHGRSAAAVVKTARRFACDIEISVEGETERRGRPPYRGPVDAKSMVQVATICGARPGAEFTIEATGEGADDALDALEREIRWRIGG